MANPIDRFRGSGGRRAAGAGRAPTGKAGAKPAATGAGASSGDTWFRPAAGAAGPSAAGGPTKKAPVDRAKRRKRRLLRALYAGIGAVVVVFLMAFVAYARIEIPPANDSALRQTTQVFYADKTKASDVPFGRYGETNRTIVPLANMPVHLRDAVLAAENRSFYTDSGVSPKGIARALWVNLRGGQTQGGSTITQQYVKNYYLTSERSIQRKLKEAFLSIKLDKEQSKDQILENYLNTIYLGRGAYGVQAASKAYFNVDVGRLTIPQGAVLASILRSPANYDPSDPDDLERLKGRWGYVLDSMVETGTLSAEMRAKQKFPTFPKQAQSQSRFGGQNGYLLGEISKELQARGLSKDDIDNGGLRIVTTLDSKAQASAVAAVDQEFPKTKNKGLRVGLAAIEPGTGRILAMYGGKDFLGKDKFAQVNAATYPIQPGSQMKVFSIAAGLEGGDTLQTRYVSNSPLRLPGTTNGKPNSVRNEFNMSYRPGTQDLMYGLQESINTVFVDQTLKHGPEKVRDAMVRAGIPDDAPGLNNNALIALGIASITPLQVANSYATLCSGGTRATPFLVAKVIKSNGGEFPLTKIPAPVTGVFDDAVVSDVLRAMQNVVTRGTGGYAGRNLGRPAAGKTGTHQDLTAWFSGCTPQMAAAVDYFKGPGTESLDGAGGLATFFGSRFPTQTWTAFMKGALEGKPIENFKLTKGLTPTATPTPTQAPPVPTGEPTTGPTGFPGFPDFPDFPDFPGTQPTPQQTLTPAPTATTPSTPAPSATATSGGGGGGGGGGDEDEVETEEDFEFRRGEFGD
ncbi:MAG: transglycosylase domain-containing protein [Sporichthyaceae bacterium]